MSRIQAESFAELTIVRREREQEDRAFAEVLGCAQRFSPRVQAIESPQESSDGAALLLDISNSERLFGSARRIAETLLREIRRLGYEANIAVSGNAHTAMLAAATDAAPAAGAGITIIPCGEEAQALARLPLTVMALEPAQAEMLSAWGVRTVGQLAALPLKPLIARMGEDGDRLHRMARGGFDHLLAPEQEPADAELVERVELEEAVELLEPLLFLMSRALERLSQRAGERALAIASVESCLVLDDAEHSEHRRTVRPALPERDHHTLLKLIQLDLELHPPPSGIVAFTMRARPARAQKVQQGLFAAQAPETGRLEVLLARLRKLVGEGRVGAPELLDTHAPEGFRVNPFAVHTEAAPATLLTPHSPNKGGCELPRITSSLRMMRPPLAVGIGMNGAALASLFVEGKRFAVQRCSGPWRTSGAWWMHPGWCREEWDVVVMGEVARETARQERPQRCLRLAHDPGAGGYGPTDGPPAAGAGWYVLGIYD